jgi:alpha-1,2-mannosyltransferase
VLILSIGLRLAWTYLLPNGANFVDLHVYLGGAAALDLPGTLYDYVYADQTPDFPLPFTYPPFAAVLFYPLHLLPFGLVALAWQLGIVAALYGVVRISQRLLPDGHRSAGGTRGVAMLWTAVGIWLEPLRSTFDYGQVNVLLVLAVLYAVYSTRLGRWSETDAGGLRVVLPRRAALVHGGVLRGRVHSDDRGVGPRRR